MGADGSNPALVVEDDRVNVLPRWSGGEDLVYSSIRRVLDPSDRHLRRVSVSGGKPQIYALSVDPLWGDVATDGRLVARAPNGGLQVFDPRTGQTQKLDRVSSPGLKWSPDGRRFSYARAPGRADDPQAGLWLDEFSGQPRLLFRGWVVWHSWTGQEELLVLEGKPDLNGVLWRVRPDGSRTRLAATLRLLHTYWISLPYTRFDASPDGRRMVTEALEVHDADIGMMENIP